MEAHAGSWIAGDSIAIFDREIGENEAEINEEQLDREVDDVNSTMIIIMEDEGAVDLGTKQNNLEVIYIETRKAPTV